MKAHVLKKAAPVGSAAGLILAACVLPTRAADLLLNPGFESPSDPGTNNDYEASGWNYILDGERATFYNDTPGGSWSVWLKTFEGTETSNPTGIAGNTSGGIYQTVNIPASGDGTNYTLSADFLFEVGYPQSGSQLDYQMAFLNSSGFQVGSSAIGYINPTDPNAQTSITWFPYTLTGKAPAGASQIQVEFDWIGGSTVSGESQSAFVDNADLEGVGTPPGQFEWVTNGIGDWNISSNWSTGNVPNGVGVEADLTSAITATTTIAEDASTPVVLGTLLFNNTNTYNIAGPYTASLQMNGGGSGALIQVDSGTQELDIPLVIADNTTLNVSGGSELLIANPITIGNGLAVTQTGAGTVAYQSSITLGTGSSLQINSAIKAGALSIGPSSKVTLAPTAAGSAFTAQFNSVGMVAGSSTFDLANNSVVVDYGSTADPAASIASYLAAGYAGGKWTGKGIFSSTVAGLNATQSKIDYSIGYADAADGEVTSLPAGEILIEPTIAGDAKLQGSVGFGDFQVLAQYFGHIGGWDEGNFTYGATVDFADFQVLAQDFGDNSSGITASELASIDSFAAQFGDAVVPNADGVGLAIVSVPEPASIGLIALGGAALLGRRRRNRS
jgi:PEP-CTERM motif